MTLTVIKLGGNLLDGEALPGLCADVARLTRRGDRLVLVHGGGPQATAMQKQMGIEPNLVAGRRITDRATLDIMKMVLGGRLNIDLCAALVAAGAQPVGLTGASSLVVRATRRPPRRVVGGGPDPVDFGHVGDVTGVNEELIHRLIDGGYTPVVACLGASPEGEVLNINGDTVANAVAARLRADHLFMVTSTNGVLRDVGDPASRIPTLTPSEIERAIAEGVIAGGMIPKVTESLGGLAAGIGAIHVVGDLGPGDLVREIDSPGSVGTAILPERSAS